MRAHYSSFLFFLSLPILFLTVAVNGSTKAQTPSHRRVLHQPLFPETSTPPPDVYLTPPPPPPVDPSFSNPEDQPFFHESPAIPNSYQNQPPPSSSNVNSSIPEATQPSKPTKTVAIAISVGIVTLGMLTALAFFLYRHRGKHAGDSQKLVGGNNGDRYPEDSRVPPSSFLYIGTVEPSQSSVVEPRTVTGASSSPYRKLNSIKMSDRHRPSPELQPLPPLPKPLVAKSRSLSSSSDEENHETAFHTPQGSSVVSNEEGYGQSVNQVSSATVKSDKNSSVPHSKRTSPKSRLSISSSKVGQSPVTPSPPPPPPPPTSPFQQPQPQISSNRPKFSKHPPPPNLALLQSLSNSSPNPQIARKPGPPQPPPPPLPPAFPPLISKPRKVKPSERSLPSTPTPLSSKVESWSAIKTKPNSPPSSGLSNSVDQVHRTVSSSEKLEADDSEGVKPKLKPLHWDKVRATSERATVWDQLKSSSFQVNENMMETLFGFNAANPASKEPARKTIFPSSMEKENRVLDPKKSQNIAILLRALNVTHDEVAEALSDGNPECLGPELLETLVKMAPTKEEEIKLKDYRGDISKLGSAERFLKAILDIPFAFKRVDAMLYRGNFDTEVNYLRKAFQTLEAASDELKNSRLFLKLLEAVLKTGNRMNIGTNRGDAKAFKLETLLKLVDIKGTDGKTTLLHFVVQEMIRSEGEGGDMINGNLPTKTVSNLKEDQFKKQGLKIVGGLSRDLINVKKAAGMDSDVLSSYVSKLEMGLEKVRLVLQMGKPDAQATFFDSMNAFLKEAEEEIVRIKADEKKALWLVKAVTEYFHGDAAKEEAHPLRIFMIVKDFLTILDQVCKEVGRMQVVVGSARSFRLPSSVSLPVLNRYTVRQDQCSDEESSSPALKSNLHPLEDSIRL